MDKLLMIYKRETGCTPELLECLTLYYSVEEREPLWVDCDTSDPVFRDMETEETNLVLIDSDYLSWLHEEALKAQLI